MREWRARYGRLPTSYDWPATYARRRAGAALERLVRGEWPAGGVVTRLFGTWAAARRAAVRVAAAVTGERSSVSLSRLGTQARCVPNPPESSAQSANPTKDELTPTLAICSDFLVVTVGSHVIRVGEVPRSNLGASIGPVRGARRRRPPPAR